VHTGTLVAVRFAPTPNLHDEKVIDGRLPIRPTSNQKSKTTFTPPRSSPRIPVLRALRYCSTRSI